MAVSGLAWSMEFVRDSVAVSLCTSYLSVLTMKKEEAAYMPAILYHV